MEQGMEDVEPSDEDERQAAQSLQVRAPKRSTHHRVVMSGEL